MHSHDTARYGELFAARDNVSYYLSVESFRKFMSTLIMSVFLKCAQEIGRQGYKLSEVNCSKMYHYSLP